MQGLLWYDADPTRPIEEKILRGAERYLQKTGHWPAVCQVHTAAEAPPELDLNGHTIRIQTTPYVLKHHYFLGDEHAADLGDRETETPTTRDLLQRQGKLRDVAEAK